VWVDFPFRRTRDGALVKSRIISATRLKRYTSELYANDSKITTQLLTFLRWNWKGEVELASGCRRGMDGCL